MTAPTSIDWLKLDELREKATEGPWIVDRENATGVLARHEMHNPDKGGVCCTNGSFWQRDENESKANAAFIVAWENSYPALRAIAGGEGEREGWNAAIEAAKDAIKAKYAVHEMVEALDVVVLLRKLERKPPATGAQP